MSRDICIYLEFLTDAHKQTICAAAQAAGFTPHFFTLDQFDEARACVQNCEVLFAHSPELLRAAPASLQWYCCSFAGADPYCKNDGIFANPDCLLTNSAGAYGVTWTDLHQCLPPFVADTLAQALPVLGRKLRGYDDPDAVMTAVESRSSSPVRIPRDETYQSALRGLYPCGEGAGYAGGILSAAADGMRAAEHICQSIQQEVHSHES